MNKPSKQGIALANEPVLRFCKLASLVLAFGLLVERSAAGNHQAQDRDVWFVHATDPHLFVPAKNRATDNVEQNQTTLSDLLKFAGSLSERKDRCAFIVLTGDLGVDPCDIPTLPTAGGLAGENQGAGTSKSKQKAPDTRSPEDCIKQVNPGERSEQVTKTVNTLSKASVRDIYLVAGNNDIAKESASDQALEYFNKFISAVQAKLAEQKSPLQLHNLTSCYVSGETNTAGCYADIPETNYRLIGFPSYSFKNEEKDVGAADALLKQQEAQANQFKKFDALLADAGQAGKKVLIVSHTPEIDDPFALGQSLFRTPSSSPGATTSSEESIATVGETKNKQTANADKSAAGDQNALAKTPSVGTWKISDDLVRDWEAAMGSDSVAAVLAGHLHDAHKEVYRRPYTWSSYRPDFAKLFLAPPLAVKNQVSSPIQARGFSLVHLQSNRVTSRIYWYNSETHEFTPDAKLKPHWERHGVWKCLCRCLRNVAFCLWHLDQADTALVRMAVMLIAFLTAFLTIVAIWQITPSGDPFADDKKPGEAVTKTNQNGSNASTESTPFSNRFGKTVIAGLSGLAVTEVAKSLGNQQPSPDTRWYYIVWFILFFFFLLLLLNLWRALVEASRARVAVIHYPLGMPGSVSTWHRFTHWLASLQVPLLTFSDTFINLIQGKNQTRTKVFENRIIDQQRNLVRVADSIRTSLSHLIEGQVRQKRAVAEKDAAAKSETAPSPDQPDLVRVNISVLSKDQTNVFYISRAVGSSYSEFSKRSVAWVSVFTGQIRWYQSWYHDQSNYGDVVLFDNHTVNGIRVIPGDNDLLMLQDHYQVRADEDYHAFVLFPVPSPRRGFGSDYVKGAIHISFRENSDFDFIWNGNTIKPVAEPAKPGDVPKPVESADPANPRKPAKPPPIYYPTPQRMVEDWCKDDGIRAALNNSIAALGELLRGFNEIIYKNYIEANQPD